MRSNPRHSTRRISHWRRLRVPLLLLPCAVVVVLAVGLRPGTTRSAADGVRRLALALRIVPAGGGASSRGDAAKVVDRGGAAGVPRAKLDRRLPRARDASSAAPELRQSLDAGGSSVVDAGETRWLEGSVIDAIGGPVAGARVLIRPSPSERSAPAYPERVVISDSRGGFRARVPRSALLIEASAEGYAIARKVLTGPLGGVQLVLVAGGSIAGRVLRERDEPVSGALVQVSPTLRQLVGGEARTDESGEFLVSGVPAGVVRVTASAPGLEPSSEWVRLNVAEAYGTVVFRLTSGRSIAGIIRVAGAPCASGSVQLDGPLGGVASIGGGGAYRLDGVSPGRHSVAALCDGVAPAARSLDVEGSPGVTELDWELDVGLALRGTVSLSTGEPLGGVPVLVTATTPAEPAGAEGAVLARTLMTQAASQCSSDVGGRFSCGGLLPGWYVATPMTARGAASGSAPIYLDAQSSPEVRLVLADSGTIHVKLTEAPASGVPFAGVYARGSRPFPIAAAPRGDEFVLENLPLDHYRVSIGRGVAQAGPSTAEVTLARPGEVVQVALQPPQPVSIVGRVLDTDGTPVPEAWVYASLSLPGIPIAIDAGQPVMTDADGNFEIAGLEPGHYRLRAVHNLGEGQRPQVLAGEEVNVILEAYGEVRGHVVTEEGQPVPRFSVVASRQPVGEPVTANGEAGFWSARWLAPGDYRIAVFADTGGAVGTLRIEPGQSTSIDSVLDASLVGSKMEGAWKPAR